MRFAAGIMTPRQLGPISLMPYFCAARSAASASDLDDACDCRGRRSNHHKFGYKWQFTKAADRGDAIDVGIMRIDESKLALESRLVNIMKNGPPDGPSPRASPDQRE